MEEHRTGRRPYGDAVWPPPDEEGLPPSARVYGRPAPPSRVAMPSWARRVAVPAVAVVLGTALVAGAVATAVTALGSPGAPPAVADAVAGVRYPLPGGWTPRMVPPVTGFTSVAGVDDGALVMTRPGNAGDAVAALGPRAAAIGLADLYGRLLLHGDTVEVVDDRWLSVGGYTGHSRALRATYTDVVNRPSYLRVTLLTKDGRSVVVVGLAQPDGPRRRAEIDAVVNGLR
ncbi:hypothetical protein Skr01_17440 [Sphaerisporangium krabiense]|uniref:Uncharacterized protein n=1 Tax=Sphaerisporangium krabiense TaxID=763782 RepID=A0A7W8YZ14_9ACTN|nr:hypothetical protein [Sphaerisporangium krabiense]MBB5624386.1 hypothetical protein [Sphaerisporangium krabiense]GII61659.1 hypothetical protein Skr01_17440 [Sphaerisporangium krabiense]